MKALEGFYCLLFLLLVELFGTRFIFSVCQIVGVRICDGHLGVILILGLVLSQILHCLPSCDPLHVLDLCQLEGSHLPPHPWEMGVVEIRNSLQEGNLNAARRTFGCVAIAPMVPDVSEILINVVT